MVDPAGLDAELRRVKRRGYAVDDGEISDELVCVAVPVYCTGGRVLAAISVFSQVRCATLRGSHDKLVPSLVVIAEQIAALVPRS
ncbi:IclR family transcriptional regulator C-terminal domain-containing protein [Sphingobium sp.]|uniref:IclR family transcriptional regulator domain-containing protein n=1 Tax=Sphingobium sp. TaxID=1912891 RepID=UPI0039B8EBEA